MPDKDPWELTRRAREDADRLARALVLTQEYLGNATLPPVVGWEWYDALKLHYGPDWEPS